LEEQLSILQTLRSLSNFRF